MVTVVLSVVTWSRRTARTKLFCCQACGYTDNTEVNAAKDIIVVGLAVQGRGETSHAKPDWAKHSDPVKRPPAEAA